MKGRSSPVRGGRAQAAPEAAPGGETQKFWHQHWVTGVSSTLSTTRFCVDQEQRGYTRAKTRRFGLRSVHRGKFGGGCPAADPPGLPPDLTERGSSRQLKASPALLASVSSVRMRWELLGASPRNKTSPCTSTEPFLGGRRGAAGADPQLGARSTPGGSAPPGAAPHGHPAPT